MKRTIDNPQVQQALPPEMMEQAKLALGNGIKALYSPKFREKAAKMIEQSPSPEAGIGRVAATIGGRIFYAAQEKGNGISPEVLAVAGMDLVQEVAEFAQNHTGTEVSDETIETAFYVASDNLKAMLGDKAPMAEMDESMANPEAAQQAQSRAMQAMTPAQKQRSAGLGRAV